MKIKATVTSQGGQLKVVPNTIPVPPGKHMIAWEIDQATLSGWTFNAPVAFAPEDSGPFSEQKINGATLEVADDNSAYQLIEYKLLLRNSSDNLELLDPEIENEDDPMGGA